MTPSTLRLGLVQMTSTEDRGDNLARARGFVHEAAARGAKMIALPENFAWLRPDGSGVTWSEPLDGETVTRFGALARDLGVWLLLGSVPETADDPRKTHNTCVLLRSDGTLAAAYRKIHLFDVAIPGAVELRESETIEPGDETVVASTPWGSAGLSICYDLRFPELYRRLVFAGARMILVPSAFTSVTGPDHWEPLLRARAIENQCFVAAPAQTGRHSARRSSHGHSIVLDPWGRILAEKPEGEGVLIADIDMKRVDEVRRELPCLEHSKPWLRGNGRAFRP